MSRLICPGIFLPRANIIAARNTFMLSSHIYKSGHEMANELIKRVLLTCEIPSIKEPKRFNREDGKKADGLTLISWLKDKLIIWDFTCKDTLAT